MKIELGKGYRDPITGFSGIAVYRSEYLYGCARVALQASIGDDGKVPPWESFDELQLEKGPSNTNIGGPRPDVGRLPDPERGR